MRIFTTVFCPSCGADNLVCAELDHQASAPRFVVDCDQETGGCGQAFAVELKIKIEPQLYQLQPAAPAEFVHDHILQAWAKQAIADLALDATYEDFLTFCRGWMPGNPHRWTASKLGRALTAFAAAHQTKPDGGIF